MREVRIVGHDMLACNDKQSVIQFTKVCRSDQVEPKPTEGIQINVRDKAFQARGSCANA